jgi:hypothetical protein
MTDKKLEYLTDEGVKERQIADFLCEVSIIGWHADPHNALAQYYRVEHQTRILFSVAAKRYFNKTNWRILHGKEFVARGVAPTMDEAKRDAEAAVANCLQQYADHRLREIREAA